jgi:hypothetical protein
VTTVRLSSLARITAWLWVVTMSAFWMSRVSVLADDDQLSPGVIDAFARTLLAAVAGDGVHGGVRGE